MAVVLNLGGEGELSAAVDINSLAAPLRRPERFIRPGWLIQGDFRALPVRSESIDEVVARRIPLRLDDEDDIKVALEAYRVLVPGGTVRILPTFPADRILAGLRVAGFEDVTLGGGFATGKKRA